MRPRLSWVVAAAACLTGWFLIQKHLRDDGALRERIRARETVIAALAGRKATTDTVYHRDTLRLAGRRRTTDSTLLAHADTLHPLEPSLPYATVVKLVAAERAACSAALETCEHRVAIRDTIIAQKDTLIRDWQKRARGFRFLGIPLGCTAGLAGTERGVGIGASCGVRLGP